MKKFLLLTYYWPPAGGAGVQRWLGFSKYLPENGWEPVVVTVDPKHATYPQRDESLLDEVPEGIEVVRTKSIEPLQWYGKLAGKDRIPYGGFSNQKENSKLSKFIRGNFFIPDARRGWNRYAFSAARKLIREAGIDLVVTTGPPHSTHLIGLELQAKMNVKWIADLRDPWTEVYYNYDMPRTTLAARYDRLLECRVLKRADALMTASPGFAARFNERVQRKYDVVTNGFDHVLEPKKKPAGSPLHITYTGTMAESYKPEALFAALAGLREHDFRLRVAGSLSEGVRAMIEKAGLKDRLDYLGYLPHSAVADELRTADVLLLLSPDVKHGEDIIPGKLFEYLAASRPILSVSDPDSPGADILRETSSGKAFRHADEKGMTEFLRLHLSERMILNSNSKTQKYSRKELSKQVSHLFDNTCGR
ncbi:MAG: glycosyltransferase family 4 protein [Cryomorphaceae bacterium]